MEGGKSSYYLIVVSDKVLRGERRDETTPLVQRLLSERGRRLAGSVLVGNDINAIREAVLRAAGEADIVVVAGGTGPSPRDVSVEAVGGLAVKHLPGIGEEFRRRSLAEVGPRALLSRCEAYILPGGTPVLVTPGSPSAVRLALEIILEIDEHLVSEAKGGGHK